MLRFIRVPGKDQNVMGKDDIVLATAPTLSIREVKTYARIANDTPFIVGGLIAKDSEETLRKVPLLGDPDLGKSVSIEGRDGVEKGGHHRDYSVGLTR